MLQLLFDDKCVNYETFIRDLSSALVPMLVEVLRSKSGILSQRQAYKRYGEANVKRWKRTGALVPLSIRPGKVEYRITDLQRLQARFQDYFD